MSSTNGKEYQVDLQDYPTPPELGWAKVVHTKIRFPMLRAKSRFPHAWILEPGCGAGLFLRQLCDEFPGANILGVELDPDRAAFAQKLCPEATVICADVIKWAKESKWEWDLIAGNPAFEHTEMFVRVLMPHVKYGGGISFTQRANWLGTQDRALNFFQRGFMPDYECRFMKRPTYSISVKTGKLGTDSGETSQFIWVKDGLAKETTEVEFLDNRALNNSNKEWLKGVERIVVPPVGSKDDGVRYLPVWDYSKLMEKYASPASLPQGLETEAYTPIGLTEDTTIPVGAIQQ